MQLKQFYDIATKVSSRKSATTFGDLPDCLKGLGMKTRFHSWQSNSNQPEEFTVRWISKRINDCYEMG